MAKSTAPRTIDEYIAMLKYRMNDIRVFFENDIRFLSQFSSEI